MISARIAAESLQDAVIEVDHYGLPGPVFCDDCSYCRAAHVYFLNGDIEDDVIIEQLQQANIRGLRLVDARQLSQPDGARMFVTLDSTFIYMDEAN